MLEKRSFFEFVTFSPLTSFGLCTHFRLSSRSPQCLDSWVADDRQQEEIEERNRIQCVIGKKKAATADVVLLFKRIRRARIIDRRFSPITPSYIRDGGESSSSSYMPITLFYIRQENTLERQALNVCIHLDLSLSSSLSTRYNSISPRSFGFSPFFLAAGLIPRLPSLLIIRPPSFDFLPSSCIRRIGSSYFVCLRVLDAHFLRAESIAKSSSSLLL